MGKKGPTKITCPKGFETRCVKIRKKKKVPSRRELLKLINKLPLVEQKRLQKINKELEQDKQKAIKANKNVVTDEKKVKEILKPFTNPELQRRPLGKIEAPTDDPIIIINETDPIIVEEVIPEEDTAFLPCPSVETDSISILFPSLGVSLTTALWDKIIIDGKSHDIINVDIRNNRNCDITLAVGSQWQRVTGQIFKSDIEEFTVVTNGTKPFSSIPFDGTIDCNAGSCAGQEIQWCFIAKATVDDVTEIVDPFCGKKFYR